MARSDWGQHHQPVRAVAAAPINPQEQEEVEKSSGVIGTGSSASGASAGSGCEQHLQRWQQIQAGPALAAGAIAEWLDQGEDDGKIVRELYARDNNIISARQKLERNRKETWAAERWKFMKGNTLQFYNKLTGGFVRLHPDGIVDAVGEKTDKYGLFDIIFNKGNICIFQSHEIRHLSLALNNGFVTGMASGGASTELRVRSQPNRCALLESAQVPGHTVIFDSHGQIADESSTGYAGLSKEFVVFVKLFRFPILAITRKLKLLFAWTWAVCCGDFAPP
ncbi:hypothetical protein QTO34_007704 [Cnephaeus nilssonii]|uniref:Uncharacterized protein n=1 Tax=Cnephaeus nilssonii TaxID=3371016 RepID=A0AA40LGQ1_CNENI|nr:hypothetical protein QTO34_007704 [Eptesicus nilssonii]